MLEKLSKNFVVGSVKVFDVSPDGGCRQVYAGKNTYMYSGADICAKLLAGDVTYSIGAMYFEFENLASPGDPVVAPSYDRSGGISYYTSLASPRDFLRVPLVISPSLISSNDTNFDNNQITFFALSDGYTGQNGLAFSSAANSAVFGGALVATPTPGTQANDLIFSRTYWADDAVEKAENHQIGVQWTLQFQ